MEMEEKKPYNFELREHRCRSYSAFKFLLVRAELEQKLLLFSPAKEDGEAGLG